jgi:outer membrane protein assembly factor BamA
MFRILLVSIAVLCQIRAQSASFPLESVVVEGTALSKDVVFELTGLRLGSPVDKAAIDAAAQKLNESGLFESVNYRYGPGPKRGYVVTFQLADPRRLMNATVDVAGIDEDEFWKWLVAKYPTLDHKVPDVDAGQKFVSAKIEEHLGAALEGHHIAPQLASDLMHGGRPTVSFQPDPLPRIAAMNFTGEAELTQEQLTGLIPKDVREQGFTDRGFRQAVELNLRPAYEEHGIYRVRFPSITSQKEPGWSVTVTTTVEEGAKFTLGDVQILGDNLPVEAMLKAAKFRKGEIANWTQIQNSIWELERPVKRLGYMNAAAKPERIFHDEQYVLDIKLSITMGPRYKFGQLQIAGLSPDLEAKARKIWTLNPGDPFDYDYPKDFSQAFFRVVDGRQFKKFHASMRKGTGENVMDFALVFEPR